MTTIRLEPHGHHNADYTQEVADAFSESVRVLNYASGSYAEVALPYPGTIYRVLGSLRRGASGMDQLFRQLAERLTEMEATDRLRVRDPRASDPATAVAAARADLDEARAAADRLYRALTGAQNAIAAVGISLPEDGE